MDQYLKNIYSLADQFKESAFEVSQLKKLKVGGKADAIIIVGMGGSGLAGDLIRGLREVIGLKVPVEVIKSAEIRAYPYKNPLYLFVSFSGNTKETISALLKIAKNKKARIGIVTTGGELEVIARKLMMPLITFNAPDLTPREALVYNYNALKKLLLIEFPSIKRFSSPKISYRKLELIAKSLSKHLKNRVALLYAKEQNSYLTNIWKTALNETGKSMAFRNTFPEAAHNELVSFQSRLSRLVYIIFLSSPSFKTDPLSMPLRKFLSIARTRGIHSSVLELSGRNPEEVVWNYFVLAHLTSYYLAKLTRKKPIETKLINQFKNQSR